MFENLPRLNGTATVELIVDGSSILIEVNGNDAPITAGNFVDLVNRGVYDGVAFHRVLEGFVAQGGDPQSSDPNFPVENLGGGGFIDPDTNERRNLPLEIRLESDEKPSYGQTLGTSVRNGTFDVALKHDFGSVSMARSGDPNSASAQFYIGLNQQNASQLDGDYTVFGSVTQGLDVVDSIQRRNPENPNAPEPDRISDAEVISGLENLIQPEDFVPEESNTIDLYRFRNATFETGTYIFVGQDERNAVANSPELINTFELEGDGNTAFKASTETGDDLLPFYRIRSLETEGTYSLVSTAEYDAIFDPDSDQNDKWVKEGFGENDTDIPEFYLYGANTGEGVEFNRFQNNSNGTFLFAGPDETAAINDDPNLSATFTNQGVAFESLV